MPYKSLEEKRTKARQRYARQKKELVRYHRIRADLIKQLGGRCVHCGITDARVLTVDHRDGGGEQQRRTISMMRFYRLVGENPGPYQLLCHNCNHLKRIFNNEDIRKPADE